MCCSTTIGTTTINPTTTKVVRSVESPRTKLQTLRDALKPSAKQVTFDPLLVKSTPSPRPFRDLTITKNRNNNRRRSRNAAIDLVGVETNPGPNPKRIGPQTQAQAARSAKKASRKKATKAARRGARSGMSSTRAMIPGTAAAQYFATVLAPCSGNTRIPDMSCIPSFLSTLEDEFTVTANANLCAGVAVTLRSINNAEYGSFYATEQAASTDGTFSYAGAITQTGANALRSLVSASRLVSACLDVMYIGSDFNNSGLLYGASTWSSEPTLAATGSIFGLSAARAGLSCRVKEGIVLTYRPGDSSSFDYSALNSAKTFGALIFHASGLTAGAAFRCKLRCNYESLPANDTSSASVSAVSGPVDVVGFANAVSASQLVPVVQTVATSTALTSRMKSAFGYTMSNLPTLISAAKSASGLLSSYQG